MPIYKIQSNDLPLKKSQAHYGKRLSSIGAQDRTRTGMDHLRWILSPLRLPISPLGQWTNYTQNPYEITI